MRSTVQQHIAAAGERDEYEITRARQHIAGPVGRIRPEQRACAAVPADATAYQRIEAQPESVAGDGGRIACIRQVECGEVAGDAAASGDEIEGDRCARIRHVFKHVERTAQGRRPAHRKLAVAARCVACDAQFEHTAGGLHIVADDGEGAVVEGAHRSGIGERVAGPHVQGAVAEDVTAAGNGEAADAAQRSTGRDVGVAVPGQRAAHFERASCADMDEIVVREAATARRAAVADIEAQPATEHFDEAVVRDVEVVGGAPRHAQTAQCRFSGAGRLAQRRTGMVDQRDSAGTGPAVAEIEVAADVEQAAVIDAPVADHFDVAGLPAHGTVVGERAGSETLVGGACGVVAAGAGNRERAAGGDVQVSGQRAARPVAGTGQQRSAAAGQRTAAPVVAAEQRTRVQRERAAGLLQRRRLEGALRGDLGAACDFKVGDRRRGGHREPGRVLHAHGEGGVGKRQGHSGRSRHRGIDEFDAAAAVVLTGAVHQIAGAAAVARRGAQCHVDDAGIDGAAGQGERAALVAEGGALTDFRSARRGARARCVVEARTRFQNAGAGADHVAAGPVRTRAGEADDTAAAEHAGRQQQPVDPGRCVGGEAASVDDQVAGQRRRGAAACTAGQGE